MANALRTLHGDPNPSAVGAPRRVVSFEMDVTKKTAVEDVAAVVMAGSPRPAYLVSNIRNEQLVGIVKKLTGRGISAMPMTLREGARSTFEGASLVLIIPDVGSHGEVDAVIAAAKRADVEYRIISRKSSSWEGDLVETATYQPIVEQSMEVAEGVISKRVENLKACGGDDARVLALLTDGVREYVFLAAAAKVKLVELKLGADLQKAREELERAKSALDAARADDEAARALLSEAENDLRAAREELNTVRAEHLQAADRFRAIIDERDRLIAELRQAAEVEVEALKKTLVERQSAAPVADQGALARAVAAALPAVRAGLLEPAEALERIARLVGGVA